MSKRTLSLDFDETDGLVAGHYGREGIAAAMGVDADGHEEPQDGDT